MSNILAELVKGIAPTLASLLGGPLAGAAVALIGNKVLGNSSASVEEIVEKMKLTPDNIVHIKEIEASLKQSEMGLESQRITLDHDSLVGQIDINKLEASGSGFASSWRPLVGYTCVLAMLNNYIVLPYLSIAGLHIPSLDLNSMMPILLGMLGIAGMRTYEKVQGRA